MGRQRTIGGAFALACSLSIGCGFIGLDLSETDSDFVVSGDGDGDDRTGDGDGDASMGGAKGGSDSTGGRAAGGNSSAGGHSAIGGNSATGGSGETGGSGGSTDWEPILYHDFESGELPAEPSLADTVELILTTGNPHWGGASVLAAQSEGSKATSAMTFDLSSAVEDKVYLRAWLYVASDSLVDTVDLFRFGSASGESLDFGIGSEGRLLLRTPLGSDITSVGAAAFPYATWFCFRAEVAVSDTAGQVTLFVDSANAHTSTDADTRPGSGISSFSYGIVATDGTAAGLAIQFDDVVVDDEPIACGMTLTSDGPSPLPG